MSEHTNEPWRQGDGSKEMIYAWKGQVLVFTDDGYRIIVSCNQNYPEEAEANSRRIVACVNACAGISTDTIELIALLIEKKGRPITEPFAIVDSFRKQRDEAIEALENAKVRAERGHHGDLIAYDIELSLDKIKATP